MHCWEKMEQESLLLLKYEAEFIQKIPEQLRSMAKK